MAVDCCEHILAAFERIPTSHLISVESRAAGSQLETPNNEIDLIVIGVSRYPVRRLFISQLRAIYPHVPVLILRREDDKYADSEQGIRGEFILSDQPQTDDFRIVNAVREILPLKACVDSKRADNYDLVRDVMRVIAEHHANPRLSLERVAREVSVSPAQLSRVLNQQVGVSFRQLLRRVRIEEARRMLAAQRYSIKEIAMRVGFAESHYFSRSFKELTGVNASKYHPHQNLLD